jgi:hypothetical protein
MVNLNPSAAIVLQRIRNRIIETLETFASFDAQREYARSVPFVYIPSELISAWEDFVHEPRPKEFVSPTFTAEEIDAIQKFHNVWESVSKIFPSEKPPLEEVLRAPYWETLRGAAVTALLAFEARGKLSDETEHGHDPIG